MEGQSSFEKAFNLSLEENAITVLKETAKWTKFLSILGFIGIGILVILAIVMGAIMESSAGYGAAMGGLSGGLVTVVYLVMAALYFFPILYLFKFSIKLKQALLSNNSAKLSDAFLNLKSHYKFLGIMAIITLSLYLIFIMIAVISAVANAPSF